MIPPYAISIFYRIDGESAVYLFDTEYDAKRFLEDSFHSRLDCLNSDAINSYITDDRTYAAILELSDSEDEEETIFCFGNVYQ